MTLYLTVLRMKLALCDVLCEWQNVTMSPICEYKNSVNTCRPSMFTFVSREWVLKRLRQPVSPICVIKDIAIYNLKL